MAMSTETYFVTGSAISAAHSIPNLQEGMLQGYLQARRRLWRGLQGTLDGIIAQLERLRGEQK